VVLEERRKGFPVSRDPMSRARTPNCWLLALWYVHVLELLARPLLFSAVKGSDILFAKTEK
jgi:hypothetical protein